MDASGVAPRRPAMVGRVREVVLENFKSYEGRVRVGPFKKFTCVVGPNGAGKSNLVDAISFVLGVQTRHLRGERLQDLVHRKVQEGEESPAPLRPVSVELVYEVDASEKGVQEIAASLLEVTVFRRTINPGAEPRFQVNGACVSQAEYMARLEAINVLSRARNFLVFQGDLEAAARRRGKDLTAFFEQVSGSATLREEYERLAAEKAMREDNARYLYTRKRNAANEMKRVGFQKEEAEHYRALEAERRQLQVEFYLFRLHGLAQQTENDRQAEEALQAELKAVRANVTAAQREVEAAERARAEAHLAACQAERAASAARHRLEGASPEALASRGSIEVLRQRLSDLRDFAEKDAQRRSALAAQVQTLSEEERRLQGELDAKAAKAKEELRFTAEQREEFDRAQQDAKQMTAETALQAQELEAQVRMAAAERARAERDARDLTVRCQHLRRRVEDLTSSEAQAQAAQESSAKLAKERLQQLERLRLRSQEQADEKGALHEQRASILEEIQDITATDRRIQREQRMARVSADLARLVPGVRGRVLDLCEPGHKRLRVSVNVALGGHLDSIVVDTAEAAMQCVRHLKERMLEPMTFLPLDGLRGPPPDARLREAVREHPTLRLGLNCVKYEGFARAFEFLLGDVVIADTLEDGRRFVFGELRQRGLSCRLVTLDGETISRDGNLAVSCEAAREGATRFEFAQLETTRGRLEAIDRRLYELHLAESSGGGDKEALAEDARRLELRAGEAALDLEQARGELGARREDLRIAEEKSKALGPELERLTQDEAQLREEQRAIEEGISKVVAGRFAALSAAMGVDDVQRREREWRREREAAQKRTDELEQQLGSVRAERAIIEQTCQELSARNPQEAVASCQAELDTAEAMAARCASDEDILREEAESVGARASDASEREREAERGVARQRQVLREARDRATSIERQKAALVAEQQVLQDARANLLRRSVLEGVELPVSEAGREALQDFAAAVVSTAEASSPLRAGMATAPEAIEAYVDFGQLPAAKKASATGQQAQAEEERYRSDLRRLAAELERLRPNLKAIEQMADASQQADGATKDAKDARRHIEDVGKRFEDVRRRRREAFMSCFEKVAAEINGVYKSLTSGGPGCEHDGGAAYLDLEDLEDPYNGGIKFTAMPPTKRFCDIGQLSGGERTLAAMALLFAMQAYLRPPFLVLDEVDAHLDTNNVQALARYVENSACQTIVVSLKDKFFSRSEGLVGVSKDLRKESSVVWTWDLRQFRPMGGPGAPGPAPLPAPSPAPAPLVAPIAA